MHLDVNYTKLEKAKGTKTYKTLENNYIEASSLGKKNVFLFLESLIGSASNGVFKKRANFIYYLIKEANDSKLISKEKRKILETSLIKRVEKDSDDVVSINFKNFFNDINENIEGIVADKSKTATLAFIGIPMIEVSFLVNCIKLEYKDVSFEKRQNGTMTLIYEDEKAKRRLLLTADIADSYYKIFTALKSEYGEDAKIFPDSKEVSWNITKTGTILYNTLIEYVESSGEVDIKRTTFLTILKNALKSNQKRPYKIIN